MRQLDDDSDWNLRIGEVKIEDHINNLQYTLVVGYESPQMPIYFRLYDNDNEPIIGTWITRLLEPDFIADQRLVSGRVSAETIEKIKEQVARLDKLKIFA